MKVGWEEVVSCLPLGTYMAGEILLVPYRYKIVPGDIDEAEVLGSVSRISKAADI